MNGVVLLAGGLLLVAVLELSINRHLIQPPSLNFPPLTCFLAGPPIHNAHFSNQAG